VNLRARLSSLKAPVRVTAEKPPPPVPSASVDVRDGLTRVERVVLHVLREAQAEFPGRRVPTALLYGRVVEYVNIGQAEFQRVLARLAGA
jgi:hypothetical protein